MNRPSTGRRFAGTVVLTAAMLALVPAHAQDNECKAVVKFLNTSADGSGTKFTFDVRTECEASAGSFEYSFNEKGRPQTRNSPAWAASEGKNFKWTDTYSAPPADISNVKVGKVKSTKQTMRK